MNDELIAALERAARHCDAMMMKDAWTRSQGRKDAATIRALIADLRAGNLVRREDVVAQERAEVATDHRHVFIPHDHYPWFCDVCGYAEHERLKHRPAAGAHEGGEGES